MGSIRLATFFESLATSDLFFLFSPKSYSETQEKLIKYLKLKVVYITAYNECLYIEQSTPNVVKLSRTQYLGALKLFLLLKSRQKLTKAPLFQSSRGEPKRLAKPWPSLDSPWQKFYSCGRWRCHQAKVLV